MPIPNWFNEQKSLWFPQGKYIETEVMTKDDITRSVMFTFFTSIQMAML